ncbi:MAG: nucleotidyltransferase family protein, partial [Smithellaceae bacterium]|nr:nucleotidyltransferase family protein [Smithellaceae bacterium]
MQSDQTDMIQIDEDIVKPEVSELCKILVDILKRGKDVDPARLSALTPEQWQKFLTIAATQRVAPLIFYRLKKKSLDQAVPSEVYASLKDVYLQNTMRIMKITAQSRLVLKTLNSEGIPTIPLKGIVMANSVYENIGLREMNDFDLLVPPEKLARAAELLNDMGYKPMQSFHLDSFTQAGKHLPRFIKKDHVAIEIHWNITSPNMSYSIDPHELWDHAVPVQILDYETLMLSPEDLLLHLCMHTSYEHQFNFGLRPSCDIAEVIDHFGGTLDWQVVAERATQRNWARGVYLALVIASEFAGADVPRDVLGKLRPADVTDAVLNTVGTQILSDKYFNASVPEHFAKLLVSKSLLDQIKIFMKRVFLPRTTIAANYFVPADSFKVYAYYPKRLI